MGTAAMPCSESCSAQESCEITKMCHWDLSTKLQPKQQTAENYLWTTPHLLSWLLPFDKIDKTSKTDPQRNNWYSNLTISPRKYIHHIQHSTDLSFLYPTLTRALKNEIKCYSCTQQDTVSPEQVSSTDPSVHHVKMLHPPATFGNWL